MSGLPVAGAGAVRRGIAELIRADARAMLGVLALTVLSTAAGLAGPRLLGSLVNGFTAGAGTAAVHLLAALIVALAVAQLLLTRYARRAAFRLGERALQRLREDFVARVLRLPQSVVERVGTGELMTRAATDVGVVGVTVRDALPDVFVAVLHSLLLFAAVLLLDPVLGGCVALGLPVIVLGTRWYLRRATDAYLAEGAANSALAECLAATAGGARTVDALGLREQRIAAGAAASERVRGAQRHTLRLRTVFFPILDIAYALPAAAVLLVGGLLYLHQQVSLGVVIAAGLYAWQLVEPLDVLLMHLEQLQRSSASYARITGLAELPAGPPPTGEIPADDRLLVTGARFAYRDSHDVLRGVSLTVHPGERLAVVGASGAGKSTLGRLLAGVDAPRAGAVTVGGVPVAELSTEQRRQRIVLVTQEHHVFLGTLRENLSMAAADASDAELYAALDTVDARWARELPGGLEATLGAGGHTLDAAQEQQLALARVVLADPHTVILDEATALLDPATARHTELALFAALRGRTVLAIAHRLHTARDADRVVVMAHGRITETGSHAELLAANGGYAALWRSWHGDASTVH